MSINERIKQVRIARKLNQEEFGKSLGVSRDVIKNYDIGRVTPPKLFIDHLIATYGVNVVWLESGEGEMFREASMSEDLVDFVGRVSCLPDDDFKKRFAHAIARMSEEDWEGLERFMDNLLNK